MPLFVILVKTSLAAERYLCQYSVFVGVSALATNAAQKRQLAWLLLTCHKMGGTDRRQPHNPQPCAHRGMIEEPGAPYFVHCLMGPVSYLFRHQAMLI
ncbi:hypothetical protein HYQ46_003707 [Verticillium longisporum]|nr:hypothetical protein HYQ46_003707 [Verticillium longisporum]